MHNFVTLSHETGFLIQSICDFSEELFLETSLQNDTQNKKHDELCRDENQEMSPVVWRYEAFAACSANN